MSNKKAISGLTRTSTALQKQHDALLAQAAKLLEQKAAIDTNVQLLSGEEAAPAKTTRASKTAVKAPVKAETKAPVRGKKAAAPVEKPAAKSRRAAKPAAEKAEAKAPTRAKKAAKTEEQPRKRSAARTSGGLPTAQPQKL